jgi:hypothetical protein
MLLGRTLQPRQRKLPKSQEGNEATQAQLWIVAADFTQIKKIGPLLTLSRSAG